MKICKKCEKFLLLGAFSKDRSREDGLSDLCRGCRKEERKRNKERRIKIEKKVPDRKLCPYCEKEKSASEFYKRADALTGLSSHCKECCRKQDEKYHKRRVDDIVDVGFKFCISCEAEYSVTDFTVNRQKEDGRNPYCKYCSRGMNHEAMRRRSENPVTPSKTGEKLCPACGKVKDVYEFNRSRTSHTGLASWCKSCKSNQDSEYRRANWTSILKNKQKYRALRNRQKTGSFVRDLGCSVPEFTGRMGELFYSNPKTGESMSWDNYGKAWVLDHWIPLILFDLSDREQFKKAAHWTNVRPMWYLTNARKLGVHPDDLSEKVRGEIPSHFWDVFSEVA